MSRLSVALVLKVAVLAVVRFASLWLVLLVGGLQAWRHLSSVWLGLAVVALLETGVVSYVVLRSRWAGRSLCLVVFLMLLPEAFIANLFQPGVVVAGVFSPIVVLALGKMREETADQMPNPRLSMGARQWIWKVAALVGAYVVVHCVFGCWVGLVNPALRTYHAGCAEGSFLSQVLTSAQVGLGSAPFEATYWMSWVWLVFCQVVCAGLYVLWALPVIRMIKGRSWEVPLAVGLLYAVPGNMSLLLPNPFVLNTMRIPLLWQEVVAGLVWGGLVGWLVQRQHLSVHDLFQWREAGEPQRYVHFLDVRGSLRRGWARLRFEGCHVVLGTFGCALVVLVMPCCLFVGVFFGTLVCFPSTETRVRQYLHAVANGNPEAAASLATESTWCSETIVEDARRDVERLGGAELRSVAIEVRYGTGSDETTQFGTVEFEYRRAGEETWRRGKIRLMTDHPTLGFCYICTRLSD